jgi:hypothetical protein
MKLGPGTLDFHLTAYRRSSHVLDADVFRLKDLICCQHRNPAVVFLGTWNPEQRVSSIGLSFKARLIMMDTWMVFARINSSFNMSLPHVKASEIGGLAQLVYFDGYLPYQCR